MAWEQVGLITLSENWQYTDPIVGDLVRLRHLTQPYGRGLLAQASQDGLEISLFDIKRVYPKDEPEIFYLIPPWGIENRKIALRQSAQYSPPWEIAIDRYVPGESGDRLVLYADLVALVEGGGTAAELAAALELKADAAATTAALAQKANASATASALAAKADASALAAKADASALAAGLSSKADVSALAAGLSSKADSSALAAGLSSKADSSALTEAIYNQGRFQRKKAEIYSDFIGNFGEWNSTTGGTGASNSTSAITDASIFNNVSAPGIAQQSTGSVETGRAALTSTFTAFKLLDFIGGGAARGVAAFRAVFQIPTLSTPTESFIYRAGFIDSAQTESVDGCFLRINASNVAQFVCRNNNAESAVTIPITLSTGILYNLEIIVSAINLATLKIFESPLNTGELGVIPKVATCSTNIPISNSQLTGAGSFLLKTVGFSPRTINLDFMYAGSDLL